MNKNAIALGLATLLLSGTAFAAPVFSDDFNRRDANNVGSGWIEIDRNGKDVAISNNALQLRDVHQQSNSTASSPDAAATFSVSTLGLENLLLSFAWAPLTASEADDTLKLSWRVAGGSWMDLWSTGLGGDGAWSTANVGLGAAAADQQSIDIRFWTDVGYSGLLGFLFDAPQNEGARIDWVTLTGDAIPVAVTPPVPEPTPEPAGPGAAQAVPEPASLALLGLGLAGLGAMRRRQRAA